MAKKDLNYIPLYSFYKNLLTLKQQEYFVNYYEDDLTIYEIAASRGVNASAVSDALNHIKKSLEDYEAKLGLYQKYQARESLYDQSLVSSELIKQLREIEK